MQLRENLREAAQSLLSAKQRTILALIGIIIGIGSVIAMVSVGSIVQAEVLRQFVEMGTDIMLIRKDYGGDGAGKTSISLDNALDIPAACPSVALTAPYTTIYGDMGYEGERFSIPGLGVTETFFSINKLAVVSGRIISDMDERMYYCVLGANAAEKLRGKGLLNPVGAQVKFSGRLFTVAGVLENAPAGGMRPYEINEGLMTHIATALRMSPDASIGAVMGRMAKGYATAQATAEVHDFFAARQKNLKVSVRTAEELIQRMESQQRMFTLLLGAVGSISLIVGGVGVMNVMLVSVTERKKEIGVRRALGAQRSDIQGQFLIESVLLSLVGGALGIALGVGASWVIAHYSNWHFFVVYWAIGLGVGVSAAVGVFFGFYPARSAARLNPIDALRS